MLAAGGVAAAWIVPLPERMELPGSRMVLYSDSSPMSVHISPDDKWRIPVNIDGVDDAYMKALIRFEDKRFHYHPGFDPIAIARAAVRNVSERRIVSGASTITMQLVRLLEPRPRTVRSKLVEILRAMQIELRLTKREILALYLQYLPFGGNIEGVEAAAAAYFGHRASDLTPFETAYLLSVPQDPENRRPTPEHVEPMKIIIARTARRLCDSGIFGRKQFEEALGAEPLSSVKPFPRNAMHVSNYLLERFGDAAIRSTISREAQAAAETAIASYRREFNLMGIHNAAAVVIDNSNGEVLAAVGNFDFMDEKNHGQVIGFAAPRSPGSAMKPFIYAMAIDRGMALPSYLVEDIPVRYAGYRPINYDRKFRGLVTLEDALSKSLNIPFVNLLKRVGLSSYLAFLRRCGITTLEGEKGYYGLSVAIGGMETKLSELANMYAMLARNGLFMDLHWTKDKRRRKPKRLLSPGATYLTRKTLRIKDRPDFPGSRRSTSPAADIFWKTGTSSRHRDAWALGSTHGYTAGIWVGNFDGKSSRHIVGTERAGPILFDILETLSKKEPYRPEDGPTEDLVEVRVCALSGRIAGPHCPHGKYVKAVATATPVEKCPYHVEYLIDAETGYRLNPTCREGRNVVARVFTVLPASVRRWVGDRNIDATDPPPMSPSCSTVSTRKSITIISPKSEAVFFVVPGLKADRQEIPLEADAGSDVGEIFWFVNGKFIAASAPRNRVWLTPRPGEYEVRAMDASGRGDTVKIKILPAG